MRSDSFAIRLLLDAWYFSGRLDVGAWMFPKSPCSWSLTFRSRLNFQPALWITGPCHRNDRHLTVAKRLNYL